MRIRSVSETPAVDLGASLGFLAAQLSKRMTARLNDQLAAHGLTTTQWAVLACLWQQDGLAQKDISTRTGIDAATLTEMLKRMSARGLLRRERDPANNRIQRVYLHGAEAGLRGEISAMAVDVNEAALAGFSPTDRTRLLHLLQRAVTNLESDRAEGESR